MMFSPDAATPCFAWFTVEISTLKENNDDQNTRMGCDDGRSSPGGNG